MTRCRASGFGGFGEPFTIRRPDGLGAGVQARGIFTEQGSQVSGTDQVQARAEADVISFLRRDAEAVAAAVTGAEIERGEGARRYVVQGLSELSANKRSVVVSEVV